MTKEQQKKLDKAIAAEYTNQGRLVPKTIEVICEILASKTEAKKPADKKPADKKGADKKGADKKGADKKPAAKKADKKK